MGILHPFLNVNRSNVELNGSRIFLLSDTVKDYKLVKMADSERMFISSKSRDTTNDLLGREKSIMQYI